MNVEDLDWGRVMHFYGRASEVPHLVERLGTGQHREAERRLAEILEHQDAVMQATPPAVILILRALGNRAVRDRAAVEDILHRVGAAARFQIDEQSRLGGEIPKPDWDLYDESHLWPPFVSEAQDEMLWEECTASEDDVLGWAVLVDELIVDGSLRDA